MSAGVNPLARQLGEMLPARTPIPEAQPLQPGAFPFRRKELWPAAEWEKMQRIWRGEE